LRGGIPIQNWHVIQVLGGKEDKIIDKVNLTEECRAFTPKRVKILRSEGKTIKISEILFKGYVILETDLNYIDFKKLLFEYVKPLQGFVRLLEHDRVGTETILPLERKFIEQYTNHERVIEPSIGFIQGDKVIITEGPLIGHESDIKRIDRHKRTAELELSMFGRSQTIHVSCEIISKTSS